MALTKTTTQMITAQTVAANGSSTSGSGLDISGAINLSVGYSMVFNGSATAGAKIQMFADPAGASASFSIGSYDNPVDEADIAVSAGHTVAGSYQFTWAPKYVKIRIVNLDGSYSITSASAWITIQTP